MVNSLARELKALLDSLPHTDHSSQANCTDISSLAVRTAAPTAAMAVQSMVLAAGLERSCRKLLPAAASTALRLGIALWRLFVCFI